MLNMLANVALPSFIGHWIVFIFLLPLVARVEATVMCKLLKLSYGPSFRLAVQANWKSTLVGLPLGWVMALLGLIPPGILVWFLPYSYRDPTYQVIAFTLLTGGMIPGPLTPLAAAVGNLIILVPYYFASVRIERKVILKKYPDFDHALVNRTAKWMNFLTYSILAGLVLWGVIVAAVEVAKSK